MVTTNYKAFSAGCPNADRTHGYTQYLAKGRSQHLGLDLDAATGDPVYAIADGRVTKAGALWGAEWRGVVLIEHMTSTGERFTAVYGHISIASSPRSKSAWTAGDVVRRGDRLGSVANTGTGSHLHFGMAKGTKTYVAGTSTSTGTANCPSQLLGTVNPLTFVSTRQPLRLPGSIIGKRNPDNSITRWFVTADGRRAHIASRDVYLCLVDSGRIDRGLQPKRFLSQLPLNGGPKASC